MRRLTRVLGVALLAGSALGLVPAGDADATGTATLTVTTLDRSGHAAATQVLVENRSTFAMRYLDSGHATRLPKGTYDAFVDVSDQHDQSDTLAIARVALTGTKKVTVDARRGHRVHLSLSPALPRGYQQSIAMSLCQTDGPGAVYGYTYSAALYLVPSSLPEAGFSASSVWSPPSGSDASYVVNTSVHHGLPAGISRTVVNRHWQRSR